MICRDAANQAIFRRASYAMNSDRAIRVSRTVRAAALQYFCGWCAVMISILPCFGQTPAPPEDLTKLERQVALKIAHVRMQGPTKAAVLKNLGQAERAQFDGEKAITAGDYNRAEQDFLRANTLVGQVSQ